MMTKLRSYLIIYCVLFLFIISIKTYNCSGLIKKYESDDGDDVQLARQHLLKILKQIDDLNRQDSNEDDYLNSNDSSEEQYDLENKQQQQLKKRGIHMQVYYEPKLLKDGSILLIPKDRNKGHYFLG